MSSYVEIVFEEEEKMGKIRVGRCTYKKGKRIDPTFDNFTQVIVLTKSSKYGEIGPYVLKDEKGRLFENIYQMSKIYEVLPKSKQIYSYYQPKIIWEWPEDIHIQNGIIQNNYYDWRKQGMESKEPIRYPVGRKNTHLCKGIIIEDEQKEYNKEYKLSDAIGYIEGRKQLYLPLYCKLVKQQPLFKQLYNRLRKGENLLICEVDVAFQEGLEYYKEKYGTANDFIINDTMEINEENIKIVLNDEKYRFGHGYCLAMALLDKDDEWNK